MGRREYHFSSFDFFNFVSFFFILFLHYILLQSTFQIFPCHFSF
uniref:Uncharacterized protein n=1 Tax=Aegilops tauschii subsp. strangulata TaxID=200361 RepID=A0A453C1P2_AEGTS